MKTTGSNGSQTLTFLPPDRCSDESLIEMAGIVKTFKNAAGEFTALRGITACFYRGEFVSIVGKSGSGKSTLVNMLTGIDHPTAGSVRVEDAYIHKMRENEMSLWRGRNLGIVFQFFQLMPILTLLENVMLPMALAGLYKPAERQQRALSLLDLVGLADDADKLPTAVSGGQQQSAAIARALANDPPIIIADEPTGNLDSRSADDVFALFAGLIEQGKTILMVTHDPALAGRTTRTLLLSDGELVNPWVAGAFPTLAHSQMLWLTHHLQTQSQPPRAVIASTNALPTGLFLLGSGHVELAMEGADGREMVIDRLKPGDYLTPLDFQVAALGPLTARVSGDRQAELLFIDDHVLRQFLLDEAPAVWIGIEQVTQRRAAQWAAIWAEYSSRLPTLPEKNRGS
jgi:ABC-type lipoprotein export system ATPase subunit